MKTETPMLYVVVSKGNEVTTCKTEEQALTHLKNMTDGAVLLSSLSAVESFVNSFSSPVLSEIYEKITGSYVKRFASKEGAAKRLWRFLSPSGKSSVKKPQPQLTDDKVHQENTDMFKGKKSSTKKETASKKSTAKKKATSKKKTVSKKDAVKKKSASKKKASAKKKVETAKRRGRASTYDSTAKVKLLVKENPKREGSASYDRFELYTGCKTVSGFLEAGGTAGDLAYDSNKGFISIG